MLKKLRLKFIWINMSLVSLVLLAVFATLVFSTARQLEQDASAALELALRWDGPDDPRPFTFGLPLENSDGRSRLIPVFCVTIAQDGEVSELTLGSGASVSDEVLDQAVEQALASGTKYGVLEDLGLRFRIHDGQGQTKLAFSDMSWERASLTRLILTTLLAGFAAIIFFFFISLFLSRLALRPVEEAWAQQSQFVADASHELKTPITVILANTGIILSHPRQPVADNQKWLEYIQDEARRMKSLVEDLLFLAKNDAAGLPAAQAVNFSDLTEGCLLRFESVAFEQNVRLSSQVAPGLTLMGDRPSLERLVMILLDNAIKYAGPGGEAVLALERQQERAVLTMTNSGPPIPPEHLPHLFERFYRADSSRSREQGGYGLGLSIAQAVAQAHRGSITVRSDAVRGTVFTVTLPLSHGQAAPLNRKTSG